ncbi:MAG: hypothetical protein LC687_01570 [Actinobacteria bacterium]|nr:hypothetical protein [Actinomycetota bacterium]
MAQSRRKNTGYNETPNPKFRKGIIMLKAIKLENEIQLSYVLMTGNLYNEDLGRIRSDYEVYTEDGETLYVIMCDSAVESKEVYFHTMDEDSFNRKYQLTAPASQIRFTDIKEK